MDELGKIPLCALPTPLLAAPRLGEAMGIPNLWLKRDDLLGLALGGNKLRKMEYIAAAAMTQGAGAMVTSGSWESNLVSVGPQREEFQLSSGADPWDGSPCC
jgi:1-aminocyclopropane-1-carboxylate deaminase/D-cysteine desulfhydrase-like pyridoxal-dependent ACC family enzyme